MTTTDIKITAISSAATKVVTLSTVILRRMLASAGLMSTTHASVLPVSDKADRFPQKCSLLVPGLLLPLCTPLVS